MTMRATSLMRSVRAFLALLVVGATGATSVVAAKPVKPSRPRAMNLFSSAGYLFEVNRQQCGLLNTGVVCAAFAGSPVGGGGFWPKGTPDQYIFWSGLQMAGRSEEHTSELQSPCNLVCRLLLEKKNNNMIF